jgi:CHAT domain-containing protein
MATLWEIEDSSTVRFIRDFYRQTGSEDIEDALAQAQRDMIAGTEYRHPYYWAPFVVSGVGL